MHKIFQVMEESNFVYSKMTDMSVEMKSQERRDMVTLHGKALLNEEENRFIFLQNPPRGARSVEVARTAHARMVRTPRGTYTLTFRFDGRERWLRESLIAEINDVFRNTIEKGGRK